MKSDYVGGFVMFGIMFGIAMLQIYVFKSFKAFKVDVYTYGDRRFLKADDPREATCYAFGGTWVAASPCCYDCPNCPEIHTEYFDLPLCSENR